MHQRSIYRLHQDYDPKRRRVVIVSRETLNRGHYVVVVPIYSVKDEVDRRAPNNCPLLASKYECIDRESFIAAEEIHFVRQQDIDGSTGPLDRLSDDDWGRLVTAIGYMIDADCFSI